MYLLITVQDALNYPRDKDRLDMGPQCPNMTFSTVSLQSPFSVMLLDTLAAMTHLSVMYWLQKIQQWRLWCWRHNYMSDIVFSGWLEDFHHCGGRNTCARWRDTICASTDVSNLPAEVLSKAWKLYRKRHCPMDWRTTDQRQRSKLLYK